MKLENVGYNIAGDIREVEKLLGKKVYAVGGCVRDVILGIVPKDIDLVVIGAKKEDLEDKLGICVGKSFGVFKYKNMDIAMARKERCIGEGHKDFCVDLGEVTLEDDLVRRDFTMNAMAMDSDWKVHDLFGGIQDIKYKTVRMVNDKHFLEDPLRFIRACRFSAKLGFNIEKRTEEVIRKNRVKILNLSKERIKDEMDKALLTNTPDIFFRKARDCGILKYFLFEINSLYGVEQAYHKEDAFEHTMMVINNGAKIGLELDLMWALLLHDIGKGVKNDNKPHHYEHEEKGLEILEFINKKINLTRKQYKTSKFFIRNHMRLYKIKDMNPNRMANLVREIKKSNVRLENVIKMSNCDLKGRVGETDIGQSDFSLLEKAYEAYDNIDINELLDKFSDRKEVLINKIWESRVNSIKKSMRL